MTSYCSIIFITGRWRGYKLSFTFISSFLIISYCKNLEQVGVEMFGAWKHLVIKNDPIQPRIHTAVYDTGGWLWVGGGLQLLCGARLKIGWRTLHQTPPLPRNGIPGYSTLTHPSKRNSPLSSALLPSFTPAFPSLSSLLLLLLPCSYWLGSAADRSLGFSLLRQNGGEGLSPGEGSRDYMTGSASVSDFLCR